MKTESDVLYARARTVMPGGVSAGGRYNQALSGPLFATRAAGPEFEAINGGTYLDFHLSAGALFFGYDHPRLRDAVERAMSIGFFPNLDTEYHTQLAELICNSVPAAEMVRLSNTGTEATLAAVRLARHFTGRKRILKFDGHFHGMHELVWFNHTAIGKPTVEGEIQTVSDSAGVPQEFADLVVNVPFNDAEAFEAAIERHRGEIAAVIVEPISFNCGCMPGRPKFLLQLRETCNREGLVLIFDEVLAGFRMALGGCQEYYGITPDLATLAKALGGGFPIAAVVGRKEIMQGLNPLGPVVMSGTYTGALMPVLVAIECLQMMREKEFYKQLNHQAETFYDEINGLFTKHGVKGHVRGVGARFGLFFGVDDPKADFSFQTIRAHFDSAIHKRFIALALEQELYFLDSGFRHAPTHFGISAVHSDAHLDRALAKMDHVFKRLAHK